MQPSATDKNELIEICRKEYTDNPSTLQILDEFQRDYSSDQALWW